MTAVRAQGDTPVDRHVAVLFGGGLAISITGLLVTIFVLAICGGSVGTKGIFDPSTLNTLGVFGGLVGFSVGGYLAGYGLARALRWGSPFGAGVALAICGVIYGPGTCAMGLPVLNCALDGSPGVKRELEVLALETRTNKRVRTTVAVVRHWGSPRDTVELPVPTQLLPTVRVGSRLPVTTHEGALGFAWRETE